MPDECGTANVGQKWIKNAPANPNDWADANYTPMPTGFEGIGVIFFFKKKFKRFKISRISQPTEEMGKLGTKLLFDSISSGKRCTTQIELAPRLISRNSVGVYGKE